LHGFFAELALFVDAGSQLNLFAEPLKDADFRVWALATTIWKLLEPRSMAAIRDRFLAWYAAWSGGSRSLTWQSCHDRGHPPTRSTARLDAWQCDSDVMTAI
jgi:hypothetical protein